ncbi:hypothetical protein EYF80_014124 [Liparis tanakae]|uniref:Uncharacterized protein n=1 Tax=Liparis tanakae TaxID=230148 RepID=A0A4Z2IDF7_9TELE|nr:hypothetical protein EYF80_014124 [Liparis tanakae]
MARTHGHVSQVLSQRGGGGCGLRKRTLGMHGSEEECEAEAKRRAVDEKKQKVFGLTPLLSREDILSGRGPRLSDQEVSIAAWHLDGSACQPVHQGEAVFQGNYYSKGRQEVERLRPLLPPMQSRRTEPF